MATPAELLAQAVAASEQLIAEAAASEVVQTAAKDFLGLYMARGMTETQGRAAVKAAFPTRILRPCVCSCTDAQELDWSAGEEALHRAFKELAKR